MTTPRKPRAQVRACARPGCGYPARPWGTLCRDKECTRLYRREYRLKWTAERRKATKASKGPRPCLTPACPGFPLATRHYCPYCLTPEGKAARVIHTKQRKAATDRARQAAKKVQRVTAEPSCATCHWGWVRPGSKPGDVECAREAFRACHIGPSLWEPATG